MSTSFPAATLPVQRNGTRRKDNKLIQELVSLAGFSLKPDGAFGPATEAGVKAFQATNALPLTGIVDQDTFGVLIAPFTRATAVLAANGRTLAQLVVAYARQHLAEHPLECGGPNSGPWVRLYMDGQDGEDFPWCAGFACFVLKQACGSLGLPLPIARSFGCDQLAGSAKAADRFLSERAAARRRADLAGSLFLIRKTSTDWIHVGIVAASEAEVIHTIEGNTNDSGSPEGFEVCARRRGYPSKDFILLG